MFFRIALPGARRILIDHIAWCNRHVPRWNPLSVVGQHMQQAGATPAEAMAFTLVVARSSTPRTASPRGMSPDDFLPRFTFFFDISISFFEEIAKFRAGRRIWARIARERFGAKDPTLVALQVPRADLGRRPDARSSRSTTSRASPCRRWPASSAACSRCTPTPTTRRCRDADAGRRAHRRRDAEHPARGSAPHRRHRSARRLVLRRDADRRDGGEDRRDHGRRSTSAGGMYKAVEPASCSG